MSEFGLVFPALLDRLETNLNCRVTVFLWCLYLSDIAGAGLDDCYGSDDAVIVEDLSHSYFFSY